MTADRKPLLTDEEIGKATSLMTEERANAWQWGMVEARSIYEADRAKLLDRIAELEGMVPKWAKNNERVAFEDDGWKCIGGRWVGPDKFYLMMKPIPLPKGGE